jgi:hypothetical protein
MTAPQKLRADALQHRDSLTFRKAYAENSHRKRLRIKKNTARPRA